MSEAIRKLQEAEERQAKKKEELRKREESQMSPTNTPFGRFAEIDYDSKLEMLKQTQSVSQQTPSLLDSLLRGLTWANSHIWDRSYDSKYDFSVSQRMKIINYVYDRFNLRAGRVSREVQTFDYTPHQERMKTDNIADLKKYLHEVKTMREHNQHILTNEVWNCHYRAKYASLLWGMFLSSAFCTLASSRLSGPKKAGCFYVITFASMYYAKVAFSERIIDTFYPFFKQDVEKMYNSEDAKLVEKITTLGKYVPVNKVMSKEEQEIYDRRLKTFRENTGLLAPRFDEVDEPLHTQKKILTRGAPGGTKL